MSSEPSADVPPTPALSSARKYGRRRRLLFLAVVAVLAGTVAAVIQFRGRPRSKPEPSRAAGNPPPDPRLLYNGPFNNIRPDVAYVGDNACTPCHEEIAASYRRHPMGRSLQLVADADDPKLYDRAHNNPFEALGTRFSIERRGSEVWHRATFADVPRQTPIVFEQPVHAVIGSGTHGRSYLSIRNGYLFQTPISWFSAKQFWDLSPGFGDEILCGRPMGAACLFCHANRVNHRPGTINRFDEPIFQGHAIGCERCHGPGERHVETAQKWDIVNPLAVAGKKRVLSAELRDAVCEQCHLAGEERVLRRGRQLYDFRPGMPWKEFWTVFLAVGEDGRRPAVSHVEQMHASRCYRISKGDDKLGCVSCHDPHVYVPPAEQARHYRDRCNNCHRSIPCRLAEAARRQQQPDDSCIACHMPPFRATDIVHNASTDHRIPRLPTKSANDALRQPFNAVSLKPFYAREDADSQRDLGIALIRSLTKRRAARMPRGQDPLALLESALVNDPKDVHAWTSKGQLLQTVRQTDKALASFQNALKLNPQEENALRGAAETASQLGRLEDGLAYWRRLLAVNPEIPSYRGSYALLLERAGQWEEAREQCRAWLRLQPSNIAARRLWITCLLRQGNKEEARKEFDRLAALKPPNLAELRGQFEKELR